MKKSIQLALPFLFSIIFTFLIAVQPSFAQATPFDLANYLPIPDKNVQPGAIISFSPGGYSLSTKPYDPYLVGVVTGNPAITQDIQGPVKSYPVVNTGSIPVFVTTSNGSIKKGDFITSSTVPGVGVKAIHSGYTIGIAEENYDAKSSKDIGQIPVTLNVHYVLSKSAAQSNVLDIINLSTLATYESPSVVFKYLISAAIVIASLLFGFILISRTANKGIDALGRNPLSSRDIHIGIILNVFIAIVILMVGFAMSFLVLRL